jgi:hypothetical protein
VGGVETERFGSRPESNCGPLASSCIAESAQNSAPGGCLSYGLIKITITGFQRYAPCHDSSIEHLVLLPVGATGPGSVRGGNRDRTGGLLVMGKLLCRLSYTARVMRGAAWT